MLVHSLAEDPCHPPALACYSNTLHPVLHTLLRNLVHSLAEDPCHRLLALLQALSQRPLQSAAPEGGSRCLPHAGPDAGVLPALSAQAINLT